MKNDFWRLGKPGQRCRVTELEALRHRTRPYGEPWVRPRSIRVIFNSSKSVPGEPLAARYVLLWCKIDVFQENLRLAYTRAPFRSLRLAKEAHKATQRHPRDAKRQKK